MTLNMSAVGGSRRPGVLLPCWGWVVPIVVGGACCGHGWVNGIGRWVGVGVRSWCVGHSDWLLVGWFLGVGLLVVFVGLVVLPVLVPEVLGCGDGYVSPLG